MILRYHSVPNWNKKNIPLEVSSRYKHETMWQPCLIAISSTSKTVVDRVLVNWK